jgi:hypothetical protein
MYFQNTKYWTFKVELWTDILLMASYKYIFIYYFFGGYFIKTQYMIY